MKIIKMITLIVFSLVLYACAPQTETPRSLGNTLTGQSNYSNTVDTINNGNETINNTTNASTTAAMTTTTATSPDIVAASMAITGCVVN